MHSRVEIGRDRVCEHGLLGSVIYNSQGGIYETLLRVHTWVYCIYAYGVCGCFPWVCCGNTLSRVCTKSFLECPAPVGDCGKFRSHQVSGRHVGAIAAHCVRSSSGNTRHAPRAVLRSCGGCKSRGMYLGDGLY